MNWFTKSTRSVPVRRTRLMLEELDQRATPGSLDPSSPEFIGYNVGTGGTPAPVAAPRLVDFAGAEVVHGWYLFTGKVVADSPGGLTVTFGGVPSLEGKTTVTASDGTFSVMIPVKTDGTDSGTVTAQAADATGQLSNLAIWDITPTP